MFFVSLFGTAAFAQAPERDSEARVLVRLNEVRRSQGAPGLIAHGGLDAIARAHSGDMARVQILAHAFPDRSELSVRAGAASIAASSLVQLIARDRGIEAALDAWLASAEHRAHLLDARLSTIGIGVAADGEGAFVTVVLARMHADDTKLAPPMVVDEGSADRVVSSSRAGGSAPGDLVLRSPNVPARSSAAHVASTPSALDPNLALLGAFFVNGQRFPYVRKPSLGTRSHPYVVRPHTVAPNPYD